MKRKIAEVVARVRRIVGMSTMELSRRSGVDRSALCRFQRGQVNLSDQSIGQIAHAFGVTKFFLYYLAEEKKFHKQFPSVSRKAMRLDVRKTLTTFFK
jgi:transcriptional regulator with XRE-family HTH domain